MTVTILSQSRVTPMALGTWPCTLASPSLGCAGPLSVGEHVQHRGMEGSSSALWERATVDICRVGVGAALRGLRQGQDGDHGQLTQVHRRSRFLCEDFAREQTGAAWPRVTWTGLWSHF